jgi:hypothetical protein
MAPRTLLRATRTSFGLEAMYSLTDLIADFAEGTMILR